MTDTQLQIELTEARREIQRLRERVSVGAPTAHKDLSLVSLVPKFSDSVSEVPLEEFISIIESSARILGHLTQWERQQIEPVLMKYAHDGHDEESNEFKNTFRKRSNESSYARFENSVRLVSRSPTRTRVRPRERGAKAASEDAPLTQRTQPAAHAVGIILRSVAKNQRP